MRNLKTVRLAEVQLQTELPLTATAWDTASDAVICTFGPTATAAVIELRRKRHDAYFSEPVGADVFECIASWDAPCPLPELECDRVLSLHYFADNLTACLVLEGGDIIIVREEPLPGEDKIEIVGSVDVGITAAAWSPDEELLALTTRANTFLYMTREFENVAEITFTPEDLKASQHVSVGWGKRETQFQGKRAKALRDPTVPEHVDEGKLSANDDGRTTITWRGDGAYVAVNSVEAGVRRAIRVYSREGTLDSISEPVDGLEGALSWRPFGNLIAGIQRREDRIDVVFFERNGLRHGEFTLRLTEEERLTWAADISLSWNVDSTVLAVQLKDRVQFWTMGNYHYYLKQEIPVVVNSHSANPYTFKWHQEKALRFFTGAAESMLDVEFVFDVANGSTASPGDVGAVGVVDGKILKLTPLRLAGVPPPMAHNELALDSNIIDVAFSKSGTRIAILENDRFSVYLWNLKARPVPMPILESSYPLSDAPDSRPRQIAFIHETEVYVLKSNGPSSTCIERTTLETRETRVAYQAADSEQIISMFASLGHESLWFSHSLGTNQPITYSYISIPSPDQFDAIPWSQSPPVDTYWAEAVQISEDETLLVSMTKSGALYANNTLLAKNCTSFMITQAHIVFTTSLHLIKFVHLTRAEELDVPPDTPETDERCRSIERGGRLVTVMPSTFAVILQMPRGNLETIYPRALILAGIRSFIDRKNYRAAFLTCRSQMVDMNIIHDYAPEQFMENIQLFIDQVKRIDFIDEFISRLSEEDVSQTLYKDTLKKKAEAPAVAAIPAPSSKSSKVNRICDAFLTTLEKRLDTNLHNLITAHVCKSPPDLEAGLQLVARLREQSSEQADDAVEHMCFLTDANRLYDNALGLYDLELTLLVAQQAQRDPREYLPFLRKLQQMPELRRQFEIDNYLGRTSKALKHLHALNAHEELRAYAIKHTLYKDAIDLYRYQPEQLRDISHLYADHLSDRSKYKEAGIAYESLSLYTDAYKCYHLAHLWRESIYCATMVPLSAEELATHASTLAATLTEETKDYISAAQIHADHLRDIPTAARLLCRGSKFSEATRLLALHGQASLIPEIVDGGLSDAMGAMTDLLADFRNQLNAQVPRIRELRVRRATDPLAYFGGDPTLGGGAGDGNIDIPDNVSLAPTDASTLAGRSMFTRYTGNTGKTGKTTSSRHTSKTRRKEERKRARGKKGTVYEEEYLVNSVRRLLERANATVAEVEVLVDALLRRAMRERAAAIEKAMQEVLKLCTESREEVFGALVVDGNGAKDAPADGAGAEVDIAEFGAGFGGEQMPGMGGGGGGRSVFWDSVTATANVGKGKEVPAVKELKLSALLN
ncbi:Elongator subunit IKI3 [Aspergillus saccharolyticus JOP 1030-1]|uniref:Elongator complex protein 1 n=1 Tax=Aspergillus saccharolyticus JOP 1030-1 TaxID=1450539 RepID=A0A318ZJ11_9EURO|nr:elongator complex protein 1 [Aspergillus saccharolyticus JOP 1030-1]PYH47499.1 elongator complex protein 1 [Aspergillus saccharolyticus JOP 1030-1]